VASSRNLASAEEQGDAPEAGEADNGENNSAHGRELSAEERADEVKAEKTDAAPVQGTYYDKYKRNSIHILKPRFLLETYWIL
jgi:hypothetical protein